MQRVDAYIGHWESDLNLQIDANLTKKIYRSVTNCIALDVICISMDTIAYLAISFLQLPEL